MHPLDIFDGHIFYGLDLCKDFGFLLLLSDILKNGSAIRNKPK